MPRSRRPVLTAVLTAAAVVASGLVLAAVPAGATDAAQPLPFSQDWTDTGQITLNDSWSGVPGVVGFLGDDPSAGTGIDPQTVLSDSYTVDVIANQTNPSTLTAGGVAEFQVTDPSIALQGSGTADFPSVVLSVDTTGAPAVQVDYRLRDLDGGVDNAVQPVALQYRVGATGPFTNVPAGYVADATTGPSLATAETPVSAALPAAARNQPLVQIRVLTSNAVGSDEWVGVDDLRVTTGGPRPVTTCPAGLTTLQGTAASAVLTARDADSRITSAEQPATATATTLTFSGESSPGQAATATLTIGTSAAAGRYPTEVTFGTTDVNTPTVSCVVDVEVVPPGTVMPISAVQGSGAATSLAGQRVAIQGVVTSLFDRSDVLDGFFVQEEAADSDGNAATSEGLFVLCRALCPSGLASGDTVRVDGVAGESFDMTQVNASGGGSGITVVARGATLPAPVSVTLPASGSTRAAATFENVEGMVTRIPTTLTVTEFFQLDRFGQIELTSGGRPYQYTHSNVPSASGNAANAVALAARRIFLDDDNNDNNDAITGADADEPYAYPSSDTATVTAGLSVASARERLRAGDTKTGLTGVMHWSFAGAANTDAWRLRPLPRTDYTFTRGNERTAAPDAVGGTLRAASFNVLNYFTTIDTTASSSSGPCAPSGTLDCRGADSPAELGRQRAKTVDAITRLNADVVGLIELENNPTASVADLVAALNARSGAGTYGFVDTGSIGGDAIKVALVYKPARVSPLGAHKVLDSSVDPRFVDTANRPALIQTFRGARNGGVVTIAVNHFKSKGSACSGDPDAGDGAGNCNTTRTRAAQALADYLATDPTGSNDPDRLILGDLNSYRLETPITTLTSAGYVDLINRYNGARGYGYLFDGQLGYLDHALASPSLAGQVTGATEWHINADEPPLFDYNDGVFDAPGEQSFERKSNARPIYAADPYRSSDHDPVLVGLNLTGPVQTAATATVQILGINDFHGRLDIAPNLATAVKRFRDELPNTLLASGGDNIGASPFVSAVAKDQPTIDVLNAMGMNASTVGNHEFDRGYRDLADRVIPAAAFPFLGANVEGESPNLPPSTVQTTVDGVRVGFIGVVTEQTASLVSPAGIAGITFTDPVAAANREAALLKDGDPANGEADVIILLVHEGSGAQATTPEQCAVLGAADDAFGRIVRNTDPSVFAIFGGHTHLRVDCEFPLVGGQSATRPVLEAAEYGTALDRLRFTYTRATGVITDVNAEVLPVTAALYPADPAVQAIVEDARARADVLGRPVIGRITADITRAFLPGSNPPVENRGAESVLGNFIADAQLAAANAPDQDGAQIAFMNPGGLRDDFRVSRTYGVEAPGEVTFGEAGGVQPFANTLFLLTLTGAQVKQVLEEQYQPPGSSRPFLALGVSRGLFFTFDDAAPVGSRVSGITLNGVPVEPAASYRIVTNSFLASGGDNFRTLGTGSNRSDTGLDDLTALVSYFQPSLEGPALTADTAPRRARATTAPPSPAPSASASASPSASPAASASATPEAMASASASASPSAPAGGVGGPAPTTSAGASAAASASAGAGASGSPSPSGSVGPSASGSPSASTSASPTTVPSGPPCTVPTRVTLERSTIIATGSAGVTVTTTPNSIVDLYAYSQPSRVFRIVRSAEVGAGGSTQFHVVPPTNTRFYAQQRGCSADAAADSVVLNVRTALSLAVERTARRTYEFSGDSLPARPGGLVVSLYRVTADGRQVLTAQTRADARTGEWTLTRRFTGTGRFGFVVRTGQDLQSAPGTSNVRSVLVF